MKKKITGILFAIIILFIILFFFFSYSFLAISKPIKSNTILIEAWISANELEQIADNYVNSDIDRILIVGKTKGKPFYNAAHPPKTWKYLNDLPTGKNNEGVSLWANSCLIIDPAKYPNIKPTDSLFLEVKSRGKEAKGRFPMFNLIINGKHFASSFTTNKLESYYFHTPLQNEGLQSIALHFDNDLKTFDEDRNLYIYSIRINDLEIIVNNENATIIRKGERIPSGFSSQAESRGNYLIHLGIDKEIIQTIDYQPSLNNKTLSSALALKAHIDNAPTTSLNIFSSGIHARRTFFTYENVLGEKYSIGIISLETEKINKHNWWKSPDGIIIMMDEIISYFINWIKLII